MTPWSLSVDGHPRDVLAQPRLDLTPTGKASLRARRACFAVAYQDSLPITAADVQDALRYAHLLGEAERLGLRLRLWTERSVIASWWRSSTGYEVHLRMGGTRYLRRRDLDTWLDGMAEGWLARG